MVLGDIDGVLVVPRDIAYDVLLRAEEIKANEKKISAGLQKARAFIKSQKKAVISNRTREEISSLLGRFQFLDFIF